MWGPVGQRPYGSLRPRMGMMPYYGGYRAGMAPRPMGMGMGMGMMGAKRSMGMGCGGYGAYGAYAAYDGFEGMEETGMGMGAVPNKRARVLVEESYELKFSEPKPLFENLAAEGEDDSALTGDKIAANLRASGVPEYLSQRTGAVLNQLAGKSAKDVTVLEMRELRSLIQDCMGMEVDPAKITKYFWNTLDPFVLNELFDDNLKRDVTKFQQYQMVASYQSPEPLMGGGYGSGEFYESKYGASLTPDTEAINKKLSGMSREGWPAWFNVDRFQYFDPEPVVPFLPRNFLRILRQAANTGVVTSDDVKAIRNELAGTITQRPNPFPILALVARHCNPDLVKRVINPGIESRLQRAVKNVGISMQEYNATMSGELCPTFNSTYLGPKGGPKPTPPAEERPQPPNPKPAVPRPRREGADKSHVDREDLPPFPDDIHTIKINEVPGYNPANIENGVPYCNKRTRRWMIAVICTLIKRGKSPDEFVETMRGYFGNEAIDKNLNDTRCQKSMEAAFAYLQEHAAGVAGEASKEVAAGATATKVAAPPAPTKAAATTPKPIAKPVQQKAPAKPSPRQPGYLQHWVAGSRII